jgi:hypothetical protein
MVFDPNDFQDDENLEGGFSDDLETADEDDDSLEEDLESLEEGNDEEEDN